MPPAWTIRVAQVADAAAIAQVHLKSWQTAYRGIFSDTYLDGMMDGLPKRTERWREILLKPEQPDGLTFVAELPGQGMVGFAGCGTERSGNASYRGELYAIYLVAECRKIGLGRALFAAAVAHLAQLRHERFMCWLIDCNPSRAFYDRMGGVLVPELNKDAAIAGTTVREVVYGWDTHVAMAWLQR
jgi:GNAT superfamily N-acetyltransferase